MQQDVLARLRQDHREIERLLVFIEDQCAESANAGPPDIASLEAVRWYLATVGGRHHAIEDRIFTTLVEDMPRFAKDIYDLREDHDQSAIEFDSFSRAIENLKTNRSDAFENFREIALSYVANERGHFISEEELFLPYAESRLTAEQWTALGAASVASTPDDPQTIAWAKRIQELLASRP